MNIAALVFNDSEPDVVISLTNKRNGATESRTCKRCDIARHVREFVQSQCLPPSEVSLSVMES